MSVFWWKFEAAGGTHLVRVGNPGTEVQEIFLDGAPVEGPPGMLTFTGPAATLLELQDRGDGTWTLLADGVEVAPYTPEGSASSEPQVCWWKFVLSGTGVHHVRVKDIGRPGQMIWLDGAPLEAPPGTMTFTGPGGTLMELTRRSDGEWLLIADGYPLQQQNPAIDQSERPLVWEFDLPTGHHMLSARCLDKRGQQLFFDGQEIQAPEGSLAFTGPGGNLLELKRLEDGAWHLFLEGESLGPGLSSFEAADAPTQASFNFVLPATGAQHSMLVRNVGRQGQQVTIDSVELQAPDGTTTFTGPGGCLLELKLQENRWALFVDGQSATSLSGRSSTLPGPMPGVEGARAPVSTEGSLPQGVSMDSATGRYSANIRVGGRFKCLGSFNSPQEAHERYLEAKKEMAPAPPPPPPPPPPPA